MSTEYLILGINEDAEEVTLADLMARVQVAAANGIPGDAKIKSGYVPNFLRSCLYFEAPEDVTLMSLTELRNRTGYANPDVSGAAWDEIERRFRVFETDLAAAREAAARAEAALPPAPVDEGGWTEEDHLAAEGKV